MILFKFVLKTMGIKSLNKLLKNNCSRSIRTVSLFELKYKTLVIDASIYMYRYASQDSLIEGIFQMITILLHYNIIPVFVFDGAPPPEKRKLLENRRSNRMSAMHKYEHIKSLESHDERGKQDQLRKLKRQTVKLKICDVNKVKYLLGLCGVTYIQSTGEADEVCTKMVLDSNAWGCVSDDMDMFVFGCPRVLRYFDSFNDTLVLYDTTNILHELNVSVREFKTICVLSGTDYSVPQTTIQNALILFNNYKKEKYSYDFAEWLQRNTRYIQEQGKFNRVLDMFEVSNLKVSTDSIINSIPDNKQLKLFLTEYNFIFINNVR